jgi:transcription initiation factor IIE alpha subunit
MEDLVCLIVEELYGEHPKAIVQTLLQRNGQTLKQIQTSTALAFAEVRNAVVLLIQQNVVHNDEADPPKYTLVTSEVLARNRFAKYVQHIGLRFGLPEVAEEFLENGSMTLEQIEEKLSNSFRRTEVQDLKVKLAQMVDTEYLVHLDSKPELEQPRVPAKRGRTAKPSRAKKFLKTNEEAAEPTTSAALPKRVSSAGTYYRLNFSLLNKEFYSSLLSSLVGYKLNVQCAVIAETLYKDYSAKGMHIDELVSKLPATPKMTKATVKSFLERMQEDSGEFVIAKSSEVYALNLARLRTLLKQKTVHKIVRNRFGDYYERVFRVLCSKGLLDDRSVAVMTLLPAKEARVCLNGLVEAGFVYVQELHGEVFFGVMLEDVTQLLADSISTSVINLRLRLKSEMEEALDLMRRSSLNNEERLKLEQYKQTEAKVESALAELDRMSLILAEN